MVLYGLEKIDVNKNVCAYIAKQVNAGNCKALIMLDGYDESAIAQCRQLDKVCSRDGSGNRLSFDLIVTTRPDKQIQRQQKLSLMKIAGFDTTSKQHAYIRKHFENDEDNAVSVIKKIETNWSYRTMAETPLLLTFICLVHDRLWTEHASNYTKTLSVGVFDVSWRHIRIC